MKFSEWMRKGIEQTEPVQGQLVGGSLRHDGRFHVEQACALGAAAYAYEGPPMQGETPLAYTKRLSSAVDELALSELALSSGVSPLQIVRWNDSIGLTREEIADRLEAMGI